MPDPINLPAPVLERLDRHAVDLQADRLQTHQRGATAELRQLRRVELSTDDDGNLVLDGYATVYDYAYDVAGGPPYGWSETIAAGACTKSVMERDDVRLLFDHGGIPLARTRAGTLTLQSDDVGLSVEAILDPESPLVQSIRSAMARRDLDEMSFAFRTLRQEWNDDYTERRILEVKLFDVAVVTYPANPATVVQLRDDQDRPAPPAGLSLSLAEAQRTQLSLRRLS